MAAVVFRGRSLALLETETVLECLERHGVAPPSSCRAGHCRTCTMRAVDSEIPGSAQPDFTAEERADGLFLPCVCRPDHDIIVLGPDQGPGLAVTVVSREVLPDQVVRLVLLPSLPFPFKPGQFVHVVGPNGVIRPYSLANDPDGLLELHVRLHPGGALSPWLTGEVKEGDQIHIRGPFGNCHYSPTDAGHPLLLAGFSTGLAPMLGIARDALARDHQERIDLYHAAKTPEGLYLRDELVELAAAHDNVHVYFSASSRGDKRLNELIAENIDDIDRRRIFLSGSPLSVFRLDEELRTSTESPLSITSDPFYFGR